MRISDWSSDVCSSDLGSVKQVVLSDDRVTGEMTNGDRFTANVVRDPELLKLLNDHNVKYDGKPAESGNIWVYLLIQSLPFLLILGIAFFVFRQVQKNSGSGAMGFGKSRAKRSEEHTSELQSLMRN